MFNNYFKIAFRNIVKNKLYSFINIFGLSVGISVAILVLFWITNELSYDKFINDYDRSYIIESELGGDNKRVIWPVVPDQLGDVLKKDFPEIEEVIKLDDKYSGTISYKNEAYAVNNFYYATQNAIDFFNIKLISGSLNSVFNDPNSIIISEENAEKIFGTTNIIGETVLIDGQHSFTVRGVMDDSPKNSHRPFEYIVPYKYLDVNNQRSDDWGRFDFYTYVKLSKNASFTDTQEKLYNYLAKYNEGTTTKLLLRPVDKIHLYASYGAGSMDNLIIFGIIGGIMLLVGCINFINLSTAQAVKRQKEIGVRKFIGADKLQLIKQFIGEAFVTIGISFLISLIIVKLLISPLNNITDKSLEFSALFEVSMLSVILLIITITGLVAAFYPALYLSNFDPFQILKSKTNKGILNESRLRKVLTFVQFSVATLLVICMVFISEQVKFMASKDLGFNKEQTLVVETYRLKKDLAPFRERVNSLSTVSETAVASQLPINMGNFSWIEKWNGVVHEDRVMFNVMSIDSEFLDLMGMKLDVGENFKNSGERSSGIIVNEEALKQTGIKNPIGKTISFWDNQAQIIGVVKDFHNKPLRKKVTPVIMYHNVGKRAAYMLVKVSPTKVSETINSINNIYNEFSTTTPFKYSFLDEEVDKLYKTEVKTMTIINYLTVLTLIVASIGLLGLSIFTAERKQKEIGIRRVLGASVPNLISMLSKEFLIIVSISIIVASPLAYYIIEKWLDNFAYKIDLSLLPIVLSGLMIIILAFVTVIIQGIKSATSNPVESLRNE